MSARVRPYLYYDLALALCTTCLVRVEAKVVFQDGCVWLDKRCLVHGKERVLLADDVEYWRRARELFLKPSEMPARWNTPVKWGCAYDCGLCPDHEQHSCLTLIELGDGCNLECPVCYAESSPKRRNWHSLATIERMLDAVVANEGQPDVVQLSGGEPTLHPEFERVRGVTFQPIQDAGRNAGYEADRDRLTLTEVRRRILEQSPHFRPADILPVPCHPDALAMAYALKLDGKVVPLTGLVDPAVLLEGARNTIVYEQETELHRRLFTLLATNHSPASASHALADLLCCLPRIVLPGGISYRNVFRVIIMAFQDARSLDVRSVKKSCVHIVHPADLRLIPSRPTTSSTAARSSASSSTRCGRGWVRCEDGGSCKGSPQGSAGGGPLAARFPGLDGHERRARGGDGSA